MGTFTTDCEDNTYSFHSSKRDNLTKTCP